MISPKSVQEVLDTVKIEDVVQDFVALKRRGQNLIGLCPFHHEKTPSFNVSPSRNIFKCFGCGKGGNAVQFLIELEHYSFPEAIRYLAKKYGLEIEETAPSEEHVQEQQHLESLFLVNQFAKDFFQEQLFHTDRGRSIGLSYFKERGFRDETIQKFGLGYAPDQFNTLTQKGIQTGYDKALFQKMGLTTSHDRDFFRDRVIFPIHNLSGKIIAFAGRILVKGAKAPKYINSPETEIYTKSKILYGVYLAKQAIRKEDECILVEGYTDVISLHQAGIENVVASSGTALTVDQIRLIKRYTPNVKILYDGDPAGIKAALRGVDLVLEQDLNVRIVLLPDGEDPDSYLNKAGAESFRHYIQENSRDFILFKANILREEAAGDPVKKVHLIKDMVASIAKVPDPLKRSVFIKECASIMEVEEQLLINEINKLVTREWTKSQQKTEPDPLSERTFPEIGIESEPSLPLEKKSLLKDEFQEKDIARILITGGGELFDKEEGITVAEFILSNIEEVLDSFENPLYQRVARYCMDRLLDKRPIQPPFFLEHEDEAVRQLAIELLQPDYYYDEQLWNVRFDRPLRQKPPEANFTKDSIHTLHYFKLRKFESMIGQNLEKLKHVDPSTQLEDLQFHLKLHKRLLELRNDLAKELGMVVLK